MEAVSTLLYGLRNATKQERDDGTPTNVQKTPSLLFYRFSLDGHPYLSDCRTKSTRSQKGNTSRRPQ